MLVKYTGHPDPKKRDGTPGEVVYCGLTFILGEPTDISSLTPAQQSKLRTNIHFQLIESKAAKGKKPEVAPESVKTVAEVEAELDAAEAAEVEVSRVSEAGAPPKISKAKK